MYNMKNLFLLKNIYWMISLHWDFPMIYTDLDEETDGNGNPVSKLTVGQFTAMHEDLYATWINNYIPYYPITYVM